VIEPPGQEARRRSQKQASEQRCASHAIKTHGVAEGLRSRRCRGADISGTMDATSNLALTHGGSRMSRRARIYVAALALTAVGTLPAIAASASASTSASRGPLCVEHGFGHGLHVQIGYCP
jgi:hypothetical protein